MGNIGHKVPYTIGFSLVNHSDALDDEGISYFFDIRRSIAQSLS